MNKLRVLIVEDEAIVAMDIEQRLEQMGYEPVGRASTGLEAIALARKVQPDVVLMDIRLQGDMDGITAASEIRRLACGPAIFMTAHAERDTLARAKLAEPHGYIVKPFRDSDIRSAIEIANHKYAAERRVDRHNRLLHVLGQVKEEILRCASREELFATVCRLLVQPGAADCAWFSWLDPVTLKFAPAAWAPGDTAFSRMPDRWSRVCPRRHESPETAIRAGRSFICSDCAEAPSSFESADTRPPCRPTAWGSFPLRLGGEIRGALSLGMLEASFLQDEGCKQLEDVALGVCFMLDRIEAEDRRKRSEEALRQSEERLTDITCGMSDWVWEIDANGLYTYSSAMGQEFFGEVIGRSYFDFMSPKEAERVAGIFAKSAAQNGPIRDLERLATSKAKEEIRLLTNAVPCLDPAGKVRGYRGVDRDVTERRRIQEERRSLETQVQQAQKMELVGRLAGGVAHDFNNMLCVILGHADAALEEVLSGVPLREALEEIRSAANRSAGLTRQLLAFSRQEVVTPRGVGLNETVEAMLSMLRRLIGEDITLGWRPQAELWPVFLDPAQLDQILGNLCVNARDAIEGVGEIMIETARAELDEEYCLNHAGFVPGDYVRLTVSDSGRGISQESLAHIFEPFYTTKDLGKGTGLGLATVDGAVKQNNGFIGVHSEVGHGTAFSIYLPRHLGSIQGRDGDRGAVPLPLGEETVLLVEDEPGLLKLVGVLLGKMGYTVLSASTPADALRLARAHRGDIHLLVTDVILPEMDGRTLASNIKSLHPRCKRLFMSGYTADVIGRRGIIEEGSHFLQKPFSRIMLASTVRKALDSQG